MGKLEAALRTAIALDKRSMCEIARDAGVFHSQLSRFLRRRATLDLTTVDRLIPALHLTLHGIISSYDSVR